MIDFIIHYTVYYFGQKCRSKQNGIQCYSTLFIGQCQMIKLDQDRPLLSNECWQCQMFQKHLYKLDVSYFSVCITYCTIISYSAWQCPQTDFPWTLRFLRNVWKLIAKNSTKLGNYPKRYNFFRRYRKFKWRQPQYIKVPCKNRAAIRPLSNLILDRGESLRKTRLRHKKKIW